MCSTVSHSTNLQPLVQNYMSQYTSIALVQSWHLITAFRIKLCYVATDTDAGLNYGELYRDANSKDYMIASVARGKKQKMGAESRNRETSTDEFVSAFKWLLFVLVIACRNQLQPHIEEMTLFMSITCSHPIPTQVHFISVSRIACCTKGLSLAGRLKESSQLLGSWSQSSCRLGWPEGITKLLFVHTCVSAHTHTHGCPLSSYL